MDAGVGIFFCKSKTLADGTSPSMIRAGQVGKKNTCRQRRNTSLLAGQFYPGSGVLYGSSRKKSFRQGSYRKKVLRTGPRVCRAHYRTESRGKRIDGTTPAGHLTDGARAERAVGEVFRSEIVMRTERTDYCIERSVTPGRNSAGIRIAALRRPGRSD